MDPMLQGIWMFLFCFYSLSVLFLFPKLSRIDQNGISPSHQTTSPPGSVKVFASGQGRWPGIAWHSCVTAWQKLSKSTAAQSCIVYVDMSKAQDICRVLDFYRIFMSFLHFFRCPHCVHMPDFSQAGARLQGLDPRNLRDPRLSGVLWPSHADA